MYDLTLTKSDRDAFDWVGGRYATGDQVARLLCRCLPDSGFPQWNDDLEITFKIPEFIAWEIKECYEAEGQQWPCFNAELCDKLNSFLAKIV